jgi:opacity protein-like surface antigen
MQLIQPAFALALLAALAGTAQAQTQAVEQRSYLGVNVGQSKYKWRNGPAGIANDLCAPAAVECDAKPTGFKLYAGYMFMPYLGVEGIYYHLGDAGQRTDVGSGVLRQEIRLTGFGLSVVGMVPLGRVFIAGRAGYAAASAERSDEFAGVSNGSTKSRAEPILGAAIGAEVWRNLSVRFDWDRMRGRTQLGEKFEADLLSLGVSYRF